MAVFGPPFVVFLAGRLRTSSLLRRDGSGLFGIDHAPSDPWRDAFWPLSHTQETGFIAFSRQRSWALTGTPGTLGLPGLL